MRSTEENTWLTRHLRDTYSERREVAPNEEVARVLHQLKVEFKEGFFRKQGDWLIQAILANMKKPFSNAEVKWHHTLKTSLERLLAESHPLLGVVVESFLEERNKITEGGPTDPLTRILMKGPGFIPTPQKKDFIKAFVLHSVRDASLHLWDKGHPGLDAPVVMNFYEKLRRMIENVSLSDNLDKEERRTFEEARKDKEWVFVQTDKTGKMLRVPRKKMGKAIQHFIENQRGKSFDIIEDEITLAHQLSELKSKMRRTKEELEKELTEMTEGTGEGTSLRIHGLRFEKGTSVLEKVVQILRAEEHFQPSFGPMKPLQGGTG